MEPLGPQKETRGWSTSLQLSWSSDPALPLSSHPPCLMEKSGTSAGDGSSPSDSANTACSWIPPFSLCTSLSAFSPLLQALTADATWTSDEYTVNALCCLSHAVISAWLEATSVTQLPAFLLSPDRNIVLSGPSQPHRSSFPNYSYHVHHPHPKLAPFSVFHVSILIS